MGIHSHSNNNGRINNRENKIAKLERFMSIVRIAIEKKTKDVSFRKSNCDFIIIIVIVD